MRNSAVLYARNAVVSIAIAFATFTIILPFLVRNVKKEARPSTILRKTLSPSVNFNTSPSHADESMVIDPERLSICVSAIFFAAPSALLYASVKLFTAFSFSDNISNAVAALCPTSSFASAKDNPAFAISLNPCIPVLPAFAISSIICRNAVPAIEP